MKLPKPQGAMAAALHMIDAMNPHHKQNALDAPRTAAEMKLAHELLAALALVDDLGRIASKAVGGMSLSPELQIACAQAALLRVRAKAVLAWGEGMQQKGGTQ